MKEIGHALAVVGVFAGLVITAGGAAVMKERQPELMPGGHYLSPAYCEQQWRKAGSPPWIEATQTCKSIVDCAVSSYLFCASKGSTILVGSYTVQRADKEAMCTVTCMSGDIGKLSCLDATKAPTKDTPECPPGAGMCDPCQPLRPSCCADGSCDALIFEGAPTGEVPR